MNPILLDIPFEFETDRLRIRGPLPGDGRIVNRAIVESEEQLKPWMPFVHPLPSVDDTELNVRTAYAKFILREDLRLHIFQKENGEFIGSSGLSRMDWHARRFEIGYWMKTSASGNGFMTEAVNGIVQYAVTNLQAQRIEIHCDARNERSRNVAMRCQFQLEAVLRQHRLDVYGHREDTMIFARVFDGQGHPSEMA